MIHFFISDSIRSAYFLFIKNTKLYIFALMTMPYFHSISGISNDQRIVWADTKEMFVRVVELSIYLESQYFLYQITHI